MPRFVRIAALALCAMVIVSAERSIAEPLEPSAIEQIEQALVEEGYFAGPADEVWDPDAMTAMQAYQRDWVIFETSDPTTELLERLSLEHPDTMPQWSPVGEDCYIWNPHPLPQETISWFGGCEERAAAGAGLARWRRVFMGAWEQSEYFGEMRNGQPNGDGRYIAADGTEYSGTWEGGVQHGIGVLSFPDGTLYEGAFANGAINGNGAITRSDGSSYLGLWAQGLRHGVGSETYADGSRYEGQWNLDMRSGWGSLQSADGSTYNGLWEMDLPHGRGTLITSDGVRHLGVWQRGCLNGASVNAWYLVAADECQ